MEPEHGGARKCPLQPIADEVVGRAQAERADAEPGDLRGKGTLELGRVIAPPREENLKRLVLEPPQRERERIGRGDVEPLAIVDRNHDRAAFRQCHQHAVHRHPQHA